MNDRPHLRAVLAPGNTYSHPIGFQVKFASIASSVAGSAAAKLAFCRPATPVISLVKPVPNSLGTASLTLAGASAVCMAACATLERVAVSLQVRVCVYVRVLQ